jgi:hypothetical protein
MAKGPRCLSRHVQVVHATEIEARRRMDFNLRDRRHWIHMGDGLFQVSPGQPVVRDTILVDSDLFAYLVPYTVFAKRTPSLLLSLVSKARRYYSDDKTMLTKHHLIAGTVALAMSGTSEELSAVEFMARGARMAVDTLENVHAGRLEVSRSFITSMARGDILEYFFPARVNLGN